MTHKYHQQRDLQEQEHDQPLAVEVELSDDRVQFHAPNLDCDGFVQVDNADDVLLDAQEWC